MSDSEMPANPAFEKFAQKARCNAREKLFYRDCRFPYSPKFCRETCCDRLGFAGDSKDDSGVFEPNGG